MVGSGLNDSEYKYKELPVPIENQLLSWSYEDYGVNPSDEFSSLTFIKVMGRDWTSSYDETVGKMPSKTGHIPVGYVLVEDPKFPGNIRKKKCPGGHRLPGELPHVTALREMKGETGIPDGELSFIGKQWARNHWRIFFLVRITESDRDWMNQLDDENEGEIPIFVEGDQLRQLIADDMFLRPQLDFLIERGVIII